MNRTGKDGRIITKLSHLRHWALQHLGDIRHEKRVCAIASSMIKITSGLHSLDRGDLWLLKMASAVHDVGRSVSAKRHPSVGAQMILKDPELPLKKRHRRALAFMTLHHRGRIPDRDGRPILRPGDDARRLRLLLGFLRAADTLDSRALPTPRISLSLRGRRLRITCSVSEDSAKVRRVFTRAKKFRLLEEMLGCKIEVRLMARQRLRMAA